MKNKKVVTLIVLISIVIIVMIYKIVSINVNILNRRQIIKEMTVSEYDNSITELNKSHEDYAMQVQENKKKLAQAISNENVETSEDATVDEMVTNIGKILQAKTSAATATNEDILEGKTAWVNGREITGTMKEEKGQQVIYLGIATSFDLTSYENYSEFTNDNFIVCATDASYNYGDSYHKGYAYVRKNVSYNSSTGILSAYENVEWHYNHYSGSPTRTGSGNYPVAVYLVY